MTPAATDLSPSGGVYLDAGSSGSDGWHATELALRCPRLYAYHYRMNGKGVGDRDHHPDLNGNRNPLLRGSLGHAGLAHHYARRQARAAGLDESQYATADEAIDHCAAELGEASIPLVPIAKAAVQAYAANWTNERLEILHTEEIFETFIDGRRFTQRYDLVVREADSLIYVYDHKFVGRISKRIVDRYTLSGQFLGMQRSGAALWGRSFGGTRVNLIEVPAATESDDGHEETLVDVKKVRQHRFARVMPDPAPSALRGFPLTVLHAREKIDDLDASGIDPMEWPGAFSEQVCLTPYGKCEAFRVCRGM